MTKPSYLAVRAGELNGGLCSPIMVSKVSELMPAGRACRRSRRAAKTSSPYQAHPVGSGQAGGYQEKRSVP